VEGEAAGWLLLCPNPNELLPAAGADPFALFSPPVAAGAPKVNPVLAGAAGLAGSAGLAAPKPPNGFPAGVVEAAGWLNPSPVDLASAALGVAGAPKLKLALGDSVAAAGVGAPNENAGFGVSAFAGSAAVGVEPKVKGFFAESAAAGVEAAGDAPKEKGFPSTGLGDSAGFDPN
jgi:hypothetical protein